MELEDIETVWLYFLSKRVITNLIWNTTALFYQKKSMYCLFQLRIYDRLLTLKQIVVLSKEFHKWPEFKWLPVWIHLNKQPLLNSLSQDSPYILLLGITTTTIKENNDMQKNTYYFNIIPISYFSTTIAAPFVSYTSKYNVKPFSLLTVRLNDDYFLTHYRCRSGRKMLPVSKLSTLNEPVNLWCLRRLISWINPW